MNTKLVIPQLENVQHVQMQKSAVTSGHWHCCENCGKFTADKICKAAEQTPPIEVLIVGCELWEDLIPF